MELGEKINTAWGDSSSFVGSHRGRSASWIVNPSCVEENLSAGEWPETTETNGKPDLPTLHHTAMEQWSLCQWEGHQPPKKTKALNERENAEPSLRPGLKTKCMGEENAGAC